MDPDFSYSSPVGQANNSVTLTHSYLDSVSFFVQFRFDFGVGAVETDSDLAVDDTPKFFSAAVPLPGKAFVGGDEQIFRREFEIGFKFNVREVQPEKFSSGGGSKAEIGTPRFSQVLFGCFKMIETGQVKQLLDGLVFGGHNREIK